MTFEEARVPDAGFFIYALQCGERNECLSKFCDFLMVSRGNESIPPRKLKVLRTGMWTRHHKQRKFGRFILPAITVAFLSYFGYHSIHGDLGLIATEEFEKQRVARSLELAALTAKREALERQVHLMSDGSLDKDMLDEIARYQLNVSRTDEIVIFNNYF